MKLFTHLNTLTTKQFLPQLQFQILLLVIGIIISTDTAAITRTSRNSGNWDNPTSWTPNGIPSASDDIEISSGHTITLNTNGQARSLIVSPSSYFSSLVEKTLTLNGNLTVNGTVDLNGGNLLLQTFGSAFILGPNSSFTWKPGNNTLAGASLFTNGVESFDGSSTLIIKKWYDYTIPLGDLITGNFGNLTINTFDGISSIVEWNQKNKFEIHKISGTLTIEQGWITLDKSGSITSTEIGQIVLTSINSTFIAHNGNHPTSFTLAVNSIINNGGKFYGLNDGNGNIDLHVSGNFYNTGNVKVINNSGVGGVSNGNAVLRIDGDYVQSSGDTRIIYNVTTTNSGSFIATIKNLTLNGGIFMGQSACNSRANINYLTITENFTVQFNSATDKFRGNGITSIGLATNKAKLNLSVGKNLNISGNGNAEFTSSASSGAEMIQISGNMNIRGCKINFNYGTSAAAHATEFFVGGVLLVTGGNSILSANPGSLNSLIGKGIQIQNGTFVFKGNTGSATINVNGPFNQTGGTLLLHGNYATPTNDIIKLNINGNFSQSAGSIIYDNNAGGIQHTISLRGDSCRMEGSGVIYREGSGTSTVFGVLSFDRNGTIHYVRNGNTHFLEQVIQHVNRNCELKISNGKINLSSQTSNELFSLRILPGGKINLINSVISSNGVYGFCKMRIDSSGVLTFTNEEGFSGNVNAALNFGVGYYLHANSIVEYNGSKKQSISGITGSSTLPELKYGILKINLSGNNYAAKLGANINVRTRLELVQGKVQLNNHLLTIENGNSDAIKRLKGYIESDAEEITSRGRLNWSNVTSGMHEFPFGMSSNSYIPVLLNIKGGVGNSVSLSTFATTSDAFSINNLTGGSANLENSAPLYAIKRRWEISALGITADAIFKFDITENANGKDYQFYNTLYWSGSNWNNITGTNSAFGNTNIRSVEIKNINNWSTFALVPDSNSQNLKIRLIEAKDKNNEIELRWESISAIEDASFSIERSDDGINYYEIGQINQNNKEGFSEYKYSDQGPVNSTSYYRIRLNNQQESPVYSEIKAVSKLRDNTNSNEVLHAVSPNPFTDQIQVNYSSNDLPIIQISDAQGKVVMNRNAEESGSKKTILINNLAYLNKGIYFLSVISNGKINTIKIIKN